MTRKQTHKCKYWLLSDRMLRGAARVSPLDEGVNEKEVWFGLSLPRDPLRFEISEGKRWTDLVGNSTVFPYLISKRFVELLSSGNFSGWRPLNCLIEGDGAPSSDEFYVLTVHGRCGPVQVEKSTVVPVTTSDGRIIAGQFDHLGLYFDESLWDGTDMFLPEKGPSRPIISSRLRDCIFSSKLSNIELVCTTEKRTPLGLL